MQDEGMSSVVPPSFWLFRFHSFLVRGLQTSSQPHPAGDVRLLGADGIGVDGGSAELSVAEPFLHQVEWDAGGDGGDPEAVPQPLGRGVRPVEPGGPHDHVHGSPAGHPTPGPEAFVASLAAAGSPFAEAVRQVERVEQGRGDGHGAIDPGAAFLQALDGAEGPSV
jgi:hypothetical protein